MIASDPSRRSSMTTLATPSFATNRTGSPVSTGPVVCHVVHSLNIGGAELLAARIAQRLQPRFPAVFACLDEEGLLARQLREAGHPVLHLQRQSGLDLACARRLARWFAEQQVQLVHAHQYTPFTYTLLSGLSQRRPPVLLTEHGRFHPDHPSWKRRLLTWALRRKSDALVGVGEAVKQALIQVEKLPARDIEVVYNGVPAPLLQDPAGTRLRLRREFGVSEQAFVVVHVARLDPIKNHSLAVAAFAQLVATHPTAQLWIVGTGPEEERIAERIAAAGLSRNVIVLGQRRDVPELLAAADALLLTSVSEGIPLVLIEAMLAGKPLVATNVGGVSELVTHNQQGLLATSNNTEQVASQLESLAASPALRERLGRAGVERAALFTEDQMIAQYERKYQSILTRVPC